MANELLKLFTNNLKRECGLAPVSGLGVTVKFKTIVADPPWEYPEGFNTVSASNGIPIGPIKHDKPLPYPSMTIAEICALPVANLADKDCRLWLWTTSRYLPDAFGVMKAWGFRYRQTLVWHKLDGNIGGGVAPNSAEFLLVGVKGNPPIKTKLKQSGSRSRTASSTRASRRNGTGSSSRWTPSSRAWKCSPAENVPAGTSGETNSRMT